jgi:hypothetical protein
MNACMADFINPRTNSLRQPLYRDDSDRSLRPRNSRTYSEGYRSRSRSRPRPQLHRNVISTDNVSLATQIRADTNTTSDIADLTASQFSHSQRVPAVGESFDQTSRSQRRPVAAPLMNAPDAKVTEADHQSAFDRAAHLLRHSLGLELGGGVTLFEAAITSTDSTETPWSKNNVMYTEESRGSTLFQRRSNSNESDTPISHATTRPQAGRTDSGNSIIERVVLAAASVVQADCNPTAYGRADSTYKVNILPRELRLLCDRYPKGKLFTLSDYLDVSQYDRMGHAAAGVMSGTMQFDIMLRRQFADAKQVIV